MTLPKHIRLGDAVMVANECPDQFRDVLDGLFACCRSASPPADFEITCELLAGGMQAYDEFGGKERVPQGAVVYAPLADGRPRFVVDMEGDFTISSLDCENGHVQLTVIPGVAETEPRAGRPLETGQALNLSVQSALYPIFQEILTGQGMTLFHCAALQVDGCGCLIIAEGGGGKTTTALTLLRRGAKILGDDLNWVERRRDGFLAHAFPEMMNLTSRTVDFFDELTDVPAVTNPASHKKMISPTAVYGTGCFVESVPIQVMYFVDIKGEKPAVERLSYSRAIGYLLEATRFAQGQPNSPLSFDICSDLLEEIPAYRLETGSDPCMLGDWLTRNVASHAQGA